ncbi:putative remorin [Lupinus albus]|uniref:Putative remorin n=1 Tax=Lupinus albus TaxID=3870 RepID=A0A6A4PHZ8_LUPAL|nr:putative remorin [Lupinus albus]
MDYERIQKLQTGIISPSKLRMKLMGPHNHRKKDGSNSNSSRTSPSRIEDAESVNSLLSTENDNLHDEVTSPSLEVLTLKPSSDSVLDRRKSDLSSYEPKETMPRENGDNRHVKMQHFQKADSGSSSSIHPVRSIEDENLDYDSNASSSSFEFDKGERPMSNPATRSLFRPIPSKWNDAEKWIMSRQNIQAYSKKNAVHSQANRLPTSMARIAPESGNYDHKLLKGSKLTETKRVDVCQQTSHMGIEKFSFVPSESHSVSGQAHGRNPVMESFPESKDLNNASELDLSCSRSTETDDQTVMPGIRSVAMRDMGTEMTPVPSQEPSRTATPGGSATPLRSPTSSLPSTPRRGAPAPTPSDNTANEDSQFGNKKQLSEEEMLQKTRREIAALGVQLGKMNIAAWASKDEPEKRKSSPRDANTKEQERIEFEKRAALWEEAEKSRHTARFKREEIKIQAWESQQKAKLEAEMRRIEAKVEQMKAQTHAKMVKKIALARQRSEEKRASAEVRRNREAERTAAQAEYIRQTGRMPYTNYICCGWL